MVALNLGDRLIVIVGETASGKSAMAMDLARKFNGEIICADSRTVYTGMDIGTAKPTDADRKEIKHFGLDLINPDERFTAADFKVLASSAVKDIRLRGRLPVMVGGTGLYIDSILYDYDFSPPNQERDQQNPRHLKLANDSAVSKTLRSNTLVIGLKIPREVLRGRIESRIKAMLAQGLEHEVQSLSDKYTWSNSALSGVGYREFKEYFEGTQTLDETTKRIIQSTMNLAKKQRTWFKRNNSIQWLTDPRQSDEILTTFLNKVQ
jgi:tRNA dimethylallyltransferase